MDFKVGDRVRYIGMIHDSFLKNKLGEVKEKNNGIYNLVRFYLGNDDTVDMYMADRDLELIAENKKITLEELEKRIEKLEKCVMGEQNSLEKCTNVSSMSKNGLLTEDERVILRNLDKNWKWIARDMEDNNLHIYTLEPTKVIDCWNVAGLDNYENFYIYNHLFQFIKWTDSEPYNIEELLKGESEE